MFVLANNNNLSAVNNNHDAGGGVNLPPHASANHGEDSKMGVVDNLTSERRQDSHLVQLAANQHQAMTELMPVTQTSYYQQAQCVPLYSQYYSKQVYMTKTLFWFQCFRSEFQNFQADLHVDWLQTRAIGCIISQSSCSVSQLIPRLNVNNTLDQVHLSLHEIRYLRGQIDCSNHEIHHSPICAQVCCYKMW